MKKNRKWVHIHPKIKQLMNVMKLSTLLLTISLLQISAGSFSQNARVTLDLENVPIETVFTELEKQTDYRFLYRLESIDKVMVNLNAKNVNLIHVLNFLSARSQLEFRLLEDNLIVVKEKKSVNTEQQNRVTGKIIGPEGTPMPGVNIIEKGTNNGTVTDLNGNYSISVAEDAVLVFSFIGYLTEEIAVNGQTTIDITMVEDIQALDEVIVVGYGSQRKSDLTGSISSVKAEELKKTQMTSLDQGLQGRAAGVQVTQTTGEPGAAVSIRVRGGNSLMGGNEPLYVIDGFPVYNDNSTFTPGNRDLQTNLNALASLNPGDIESIEILKDASATSVYGSRGANGVVLITTKRGMPGAVKVDYETYFGTQEVIKTIDLMNGPEFAALMTESQLMGDPPTPDSLLYYPNPDQAPTTDWQNEIFRRAPMQNHQLSLSGGNEKTRFAITGNYFDQDGVILGSRFWRGSFRANLDQKVSDRVDIGTSLVGSRNFTNKSLTDGGAGGVVYGALHMNPTIPVKDEDGNYNHSNALIPWQNRFGNPVASAAEILDEVIADRVMGNAFVNVNILSGLNLRISGGVDITNSERNTYYPKMSLQGMLSNGSAMIDASTGYSWLNENILSYKKEFAGIHNLDVTAGFTQQAGEWKYHGIDNYDFIIDFFGTNNIGASQSQNIPQSGRGSYSMLSWLGRVNYVLMDKYLFTITSRADGSSRFGEGNKWGFFPSFALGYRLSQEDFIQQIGVFSNLKIRGSYGITGNSEIGSYRSLAALDNQDYIFGGPNDQLVSGFGPNRVANPNLRWETTTQYNVGIDMGFFNNRLTLTSDYYHKMTNDLLMNISLPHTTGFNSAVKNVGELENYGLELAIGGDPFVGAFKWNINGNIAFNRNEIISLGDVEKFFANDGENVFGHRKIKGSMVKVGEPVGIFWGYVHEGVFRDEEDVQNYTTDVYDEDGNFVETRVIQPDAEPGELKFKDVNQDGQITPDDRTRIGNPQPKFFWGLTNNFSYKNFDLNIFWNGVYGNNVFNVNLIENFAILNNTNQVKEAVNRWTPDNRDTDVPKVQSRYTDWQGSRHIEDGTFIRLRNISLGYKLPVAKMNLTWMRSLRVYISGQNLLTITDYSGYDPEVNVLGQDNLNLGVDYGTYPKMKSYTIGINVGF